MNLQEKFKDWSDKARKGKEGYEEVTFNQGEFVYISGEDRFVIQKCGIVIWKDNEIVQSYFMDNEEKIEENTLSTVIAKERPVPFAAITKMGEKMILFDSKNQFHAFGLDMKKEKKQKNPETNVMIFYCIYNIGRFLVASSQSPEIKIFTYEIEKEPDAIKLFAKRIVGMFKKEEKKEIEKTENKELISEEIVDGDGE